MTARVACAAAVALAASAAAQPPMEQALALEVSEQRVISSTGVSSYSEGVSGVVDVRLTHDGSHFVLVGQRPGVTSLLLVMEDGSQVQYRITVEDPNAPPKAADPPGRLDARSTAVAARDNVRLDFYFVQVSRDDVDRIGVQWPGSLGAGSLSATVDLRAGSLSDATAAVTEQALPQLDLARAQGWAKLMRRATVITANGAEATFTGGGELNLPVASALSVGVRQIEFGSRVRVEPRYDRDSGRIELAIHAEVSDLASDRGSGIPGRVTATIDSVVNLELGQSLVLAGLDARSHQSNERGIPGLSEIPLLGILFGTHEQRSEHTENLIFIVPSVMDAVSLEARDRVREALELFAAYTGELTPRSLSRIGWDEPPPPSEDGP